MESDALNRNIQRNVLPALITSGVLLVVSKMTEWHVNLLPQLGNYGYNSNPYLWCSWV